jgi:hypothetical protein
MTPIQTFRDDPMEEPTLVPSEKKGLSIHVVFFDCRLHDIAEQKFLYPVWSLGMVVEGIV